MNQVIRTMNLLLFFSLSVSAQAADVVIAISPHQPADSLKAQFSHINQYMSQLKGGTHAVLMDGYHSQTIAEFIVPEGKQYQHANTKMQLNPQFRKGYGNFMRKHLAIQSLSPNQSVAVDLPNVLKEIALAHKQDKPMQVIILGSAFYDNGTDAAYNMRGGAIPSDGYLLASRKDNPFGTQGREKLLKGITVSMGWPKNMTVIHDQHRYYLERFWTLYIQEQGGKVGLITQSINDVLIANKYFNTRDRGFVLDKDAKQEMIQLRPQKPAKLPPVNGIDAAFILNNPDQLLQDVEVSLTWDCACDLDLHARPHAKAQWLYFANNQTREGHHWKDVRSASKLSHAYETISFQVPVSLKQLKLVVHFFRGDAPEGVRGEIRLFIAGKMYRQPFHIKATKGQITNVLHNSINAGKAVNEQMLLIDPLHIITAS